MSTHLSPPSAAPSSNTALSLFPCCDDCRALHLELPRLREDNEDLRASARLWVRLYEAALARANAHDTAETVGKTL